MDLILKSIPIVVMNEDVNESSEYLSNKQDFPTPDNKYLLFQQLKKRVKFNTRVSNQQQLY